MIQPVSEHTKKLTVWMRRRAGNRDEMGDYGRGWYDALMEIATEIEHNEMEGCGHASAEFE